MPDPLPPNDNPYAPQPTTPNTPGPAVPASPFSPPFGVGSLDGGSPPPPDPPAPQPDPGSKSARSMAWIAVAVLLPIVVGLQQLKPPPPTPSAAAETVEIAAPKALDPFATSAKPTLKLVHLLGDDADERTMNLLTGDLSKSATTPADHVRLAITLWELDRPDDAAKTLDELAESIEPSDTLHGDIEIVSNLLAGEHPATTEERETFIRRHGWFAELALAHDDKASHDKLLAGGAIMIVVTLFIVMGIVTALIAGLVLLIIGLVRVNSGKMPARFVPPDSGGSVYLEMLPLFIASFMAIQIVGSLLTAPMTEDNAKVTTIALQWLLLGVIAWPLVRGVPWSRLRQDLGLVAPNGVLKEIGAGALFYLASLPILFVAILVMLTLFLIMAFFTSPTGLGGEPPSNPIIDLIDGASPLLLIMFVLLGTIWAPLMEELIFRGGVYRHMRSKLHWTLAAIIVAIFFGLMHGYHPIQLIPIMALGFFFAVIREWRGSIIASMTAHFIHNSLVFVLMALLFVFVLN